MTGIGSDFRSSASAEVTHADRWLAAILLAAGLVLRVFYVWHFRIDSDEPQHLHVVWAWATGLPADSGNQCENDDVLV